MEKEGVITAAIAVGLSSSLLVTLMFPAADQILIVIANMGGVAFAGSVMRLSGRLKMGVMLASGLFQFLAARVGQGLI